VLVQLWIAPRICSHTWECSTGGVTSGDSEIRELVTIFSKSFCRYML